MENAGIKWPKMGNEKAIEFLSKVVEKKDPFGSYIFVGADDLGKSTIALAFARNLIANLSEDDGSFNSDLHIVKPEEGKKNISITQVRELIKTLSLSSFMNTYKIGIIKEADKLTDEAQNSLLKTLEEPRENTIIILLVENEDNILPTILSRTQKLYFQPVKSEIIYDYLIEEYGASRSMAKNLASLSLGKPLKAVRFLENEEEYEDYKQKAETLLSFFTLSINDRLSELEVIFKDRSYSSTAVAKAEEIIAILEGLWRDLLLISFNQPEKIQHAYLKENLEKALEYIEKQEGSASNKVASFLLERFKLAAMAREYMKSNVNPKVVLEQLFINL